MSTTQFTSKHLAIGLWAMMLSLFSCTEKPELKVSPSVDDYRIAVDAFENKHDYNRALSHALQYVTSVGQDSAAYALQYAECLKIIGSVHFYYADYVYALEYFEKSSQLAKKLGDTDLEAGNFVNIMFCHLNLQHYELVEKQVDRLLEFPVSNPIKYRYYWNCLRGDLDEMYNNSSQNLKYYRRAIDIGRDSSVHVRKRNYPFARIGYHYAMRDQLDSAAFYLQQCYDMAAKANDTYSMTNVTADLMGVYTGLGKTQQALEYQEKYMMLSDSLMNRITYSQIRSIHQQVERNESQRNIRSLASTVSLQSMVLIASAVFILIILTFLLVTIMQGRKLKERNIALFTRNRELAEMELRQRQKANDTPKDVQPTSSADTDRPNSRAIQSEERDNQLMQRILDIMENTTEYCNPDFGVSQLTAMVGSNINYVPRVIKAKQGKSVPMFINEYRIREARRRMLDQENYGNYTLQAIAESVGFKSQNNFIAMFKRMTGITPSLYLKMSHHTD